MQKRAMHPNSASLNERRRNGRAVENPFECSLECHIDLFDGGIDAEVPQ